MKTSPRNVMALLLGAAGVVFCAAAVADEYWGGMGRTWNNPASAQLDKMNEEARMQRLIESAHARQAASMPPPAEPEPREDSSADDGEEAAEQDAGEDVDEEE